MRDRDSTDRLRRLWEQYAARYDRDTGFYDRFLLGDSRSWICRQAGGQVLEVAIGTGRNLLFYPRDIELTGIDLSPAMLTRARDRADHLGLTVALPEADAQDLPFEGNRFDTLICTLALSSIPDPPAALGEMYRVLRPGGRLLVVGHVASPYRLIRAGQRRLERLSLRLAGDHQTRQSYPLIVSAGFIVEECQRLKSPPWCRFRRRTCAMGCLVGCDTADVEAHVAPRSQLLHPTRERVEDTHVSKLPGPNSKGMGRPSASDRSAATARRSASAASEAPHGLGALPRAKSRK
jgi:ubiquinone/menaquinone biosynthesis C-methylase UbiE